MRYGIIAIEPESTSSVGRSLHAAVRPVVIGRAARSETSTCV